MLWALGGVTLCSATLAAGSRRLHGQPLGWAEALFIGVPLGVALFALVRTARSTAERVLKALLLGLCAAAPLCGESALWLGAGAPLLLGGAALVAARLARVR
jgi:hypothetical protein